MSPCPEVVIARSGINLILFGSQKVEGEAKKLQIVFSSSKWQESSQ